MSPLTFKRIYENIFWQRILFLMMPLECVLEIENSYIEGSLCA